MAYQFGYAISLSDGIVLIGAPYAYTAGPGYAGAAYVFARDATGAWVQSVRLTAGDAAENDDFGRSVDLDETAGSSAAIVGAPWDDDFGEYSGSAYVFAKADNGVWTQQTKLTASDGAADDAFGLAVAIEGDTVVVGSFRSGAPAYVYSKIASNWVQQTKLAPDPAPGAGAVH